MGAISSPSGEGGEREWLIANANTLTWQAQPDCWLDVAQFERLSANPDTLAAAVELYRGDLLTGVYDDWLFYDRERLRDLYFSDLERLAQASRTHRDYAAAISYAQRLLAADPLHEGAARLLMSARYEAGERAAALSEYASFGALLSRELGVDPMPETVALYEAIVHNQPLPGATSPSPVQPDTPPLAKLRHTFPLVGREAEMEQLSLAWSRAAHGNGGIVIVAGEAGIGKSRLVGELAQLAEAQGARILHGQATLAEPIPYQAIVTALRPALPLIVALEIAPASLSALLPLLPELQQRRPHLEPLPRLDPERDRARLYQALGAVLSRLAANRPLLLILEDLHWAGAATIDLLEYLARLVTSQPLLIAATYREEEASRSHPLRQLRRRLAAEGRLLQITLGRLSSDDVAALLHRLPPHINAIAADQAEQLYADSEGNPFFLGELILGLLERDEPTRDHQPAGVRQAIAERLVRLNANTRLIAEVAAVTGPAFNLELVREVAGWDEDRTLTALDELLDRGIVREAGRSGLDYAFSHHLIQETIHAAIDIAVSKRRHRRTALVLEELYPDRRAELSRELAIHFDQGDDPTRAVPYYQQAARRAFAVYAMDEALSALNRAIALASALSLEFDCLALRADIYHQLGKREAEATDIERLADIADDLGDERLTCAALLHKIALQNVLGNREQEAKLISRLLAQAQMIHDRCYEAAALQARARHQVLVGEYKAAQSPARAALKLYQELHEGDGQVDCYSLLADCATYMGFYDEVNSLLEQARVVSTINSQASLTKVLRAAVNSAITHHNFAAALAPARQWLEICRATYDRGGEADALAALAIALSWQLHIPEALSYFDQSRAIYAELGQPYGESRIYSNVGTMLVNVGRFADGIASWKKAIAIHKRMNNLYGLTVNYTNIAGIIGFMGEDAAAKVTARRALKLAVKINSPIYEINNYYTLGAAEVELGELDAAIGHLQASLAVQGRLQQFTITDLAVGYLIIAYLRIGNLAAAQDWCARSLAMYQATPERFFDPHAIFWAAACLHHHLGNATQARAYLEKAYNLLEQDIVAHEKELADYPANTWRISQYTFRPNYALRHAYEHDEWPAYALPAPYFMLESKMG